MVVELIREVVICVDAVDPGSTDVRVVGVVVLVQLVQCKWIAHRGIELLLFCGHAHPSGCGGGCSGESIVAIGDVVKITRNNG